SFHYAATTEIYTLSLHDALPISPRTETAPAAAAAIDDAVKQRTLAHRWRSVQGRCRPSGSPVSRNRAEQLRSTPPTRRHRRSGGDRKSTRLNSSHVAISYAVFCL